MKYRIKYSYDTGDSFQTTSDVQEYLELEWSTIEAAEENLKRIEEHYEMVKGLKKFNYYSVRKERKDFIGINKSKDWFVPDYPESCIKLYTDEGAVFQLYCPWCGYFESLNYATIEAKTITYYAK